MILFQPTDADLDELTDAVITADPDTIAYQLARCLATAHRHDPDELRQATTATAAKLDGYGEGLATAIENGLWPGEHPEPE